MKVEQIMRGEVVSVTPTTSLKDLARLLLERDISGVPVLDEGGKVLGVVSAGDILVKTSAAFGLREHPSNWLFGDDDREALKRGAQTAAEAMSRPAITVDPRCTVAEAARIMVKQSVNRLPVVEHGKLVGIVTRDDIVRAFARPDSELEEQIRTEVLLDTLWIDPATIDVVVEEGDVALSGVVETRTIAERIPSYISLVPGVVSVDASHLHWRRDIGAQRPHASRL
jgi:CBS domain-containing protein